MPRKRVALGREPLVWWFFKDFFFGRFGLGVWAWLGRILRMWLWWNFWFLSELDASRRSSKKQAAMEKKGGEFRNWWCKRLAWPFELFLEVPWPLTSPLPGTRCPSWPSSCPTAFRTRGVCREEWPWWSTFWRRNRKTWTRRGGPSFFSAFIFGARKVKPEFLWNLGLAPRWMIRSRWITNQLSNLIL